MNNNDTLLDMNSQHPDQQYFDYYATLPNQQNMLQDIARMTSYNQAILHNRGDFAGKTVLDIGTGSGILSFFACEAGASKVYAIEASCAASYAKILAEANGYGDRIAVLNDKLENIKLPEMVDIIISEPMGVLLLHERMIETFIRGRDDCLKPDGKIFPTTASIFLAPFSDEGLYLSTIGGVEFWRQSNFYNVDISSLYDRALEHCFNRPIVGDFNTSILITTALEYNIDFRSISCEQLKTFEIPITFMFNKAQIMHGIAGWFDVTFLGSSTDVCLSTSPFAQKTHWAQIRFLFKQPIAVNAGQMIVGKMCFSANSSRSYNISISTEIQGTSISTYDQYNLQEQQYLWAATT